MAEVEGGVGGDAGEDFVAGEEGGVEVEGALGEMGVGEVGVDAMEAQPAPKIADVEPVRERRWMKRIVLQQSSDDFALLRYEIAGKYLGDDEWRQNDVTPGDRILDHSACLIEEEVDQDGAVDDYGQALLLSPSFFKRSIAAIVFS